jgi:serine/threonine-protein kinase
MEYLEGQTLGRLMKRTIASPLPLAARLELTCQVLEALVYMHAFTDPDGTPLRLVHRDISPNNIFVTFDGTAKVLDFGVAKAVGVSGSTEAGTFKGKLGYAAPEQILGNSEQRSDVFAVGVMLWELLAYRRLSQDRTQQEIVQARMAGVDPDLMRQALGVPVDLLQICTRAAAKRVEDRFASAKDMRDALRAYIRNNNLECSAEQLRTLLSELYASDRVEARRLVDQRMKQAMAEDGKPGRPSSIPFAPSMSGQPSTVTLTANASTYVSPAPSAGKGKWIAALVAVAALAGLAGHWFSEPGQAAKALSAAPVLNASTPAPHVAEPAKPQALMTLKVAATPVDSEILLDGATLDGNPFSGEFPKDSALRRLEVRCLGRVTEARMIRMDQDLDLLIALQVDKTTTLSHGAAKKAATSQPGNTAAALAAPSANAPPAHPSTEASARPLDDSDPYGR